MERVTEHREAPALAVYGWRGGFLFVLWGLLIPEAQCYFRTVILTVPAAVNFYVHNSVEAGKIVVHIVGVFGGDIPDLVAVDIDTESGLAFPFFPLQSQFHCSLVERFVFEVDFSQDGLTAFAPFLKVTPATFTERNSKAGFVSLVVAEANNGAAGAGRTVGATPYGAHFLHGERPRFFATESGIYCGFLIPEQCAFV